VKASSRRDGRQGVRRDTASGVTVAAAAVKASSNVRRLCDGSGEDSSAIVTGRGVLVRAVSVLDQLQLIRRVVS